jgi:hypothetical protein
MAHEIKRQYFFVAYVIEIKRKASQLNKIFNILYHFERISIKNDYIPISVRVTFATHCRTNIILAASWRIDIDAHVNEKNALFV